MSFKMRSCSPLLVVAVLSSCTPAPVLTTFGALCTSNETCAPIGTEDTAVVDLDKLHCLSSPEDGRQRCLPPRTSGAIGESCAQPIAAQQSSTSTGILVDQRVFFGAATDDVDLECGGRTGAPDVVLRFTIDDVTAPDPADPLQRVSVPQPGIRIRVEGAGVSISLRPASDVESCGDVQRYGCGDSARDIVLASIAPGAWDIVVDGAPVGVGGFEQPIRVVVERLDCPPDALPFDDSRCIRTVTVTPLLSPRTQHTMHRVADGSIVVVGGNDGIGPRSDFEIFDPTEQRWRFGSLLFSRVGAAAVILNDGKLLVAGGANNTSAGVELVDLDAVDSAVANSRRFDVSTFVSVPGARSIGGRAGDRILVVSSATAETGLITPSNDLRTCASSVQCQQDEVCVAVADTGNRKVCLCAAGDCNQKPLGFRAFSGVNAENGAVDEGISLAMVAERYAVIVGAGRDSPAGALALLDTRLEQPSFETIAAMERTGAAALTLNESEVLIVGGVDADGAPTAVVELFDIARRQVIVKTPLSRPVARPLLARFGNAFVVVDNGGGDEPIIYSTGSAVAARSTLLSGRVGGALVADGEGARILVAGGLIDGTHSRVVERLELVAKDADIAGEPLSCLTTPVVDGRIAGNTLTADDVVRYHQCELPGHPFGRDNLFTFELEQSGSLRVVNMQDDDQFFGSAHTVTLLKGTCDDYEEVACGTGEEDIALFAGNLTPGPYIIVVDYTRTVSSNDDIIYGGTTWSAQALLGPVLECPIDENDPRDDEIAGATFIAPVVDDFASSAGRLCRGDVDRILFEHQGGDSGNAVDVSGVLPTGIAVQRAIVDTEASIAAGHPVAVAVTGPLITDLNEAPIGTYLATLTSSQSSLDFINWSISITQQCRPDLDDSLLAELDNNTVERAPHLTAGQSVTRVQCTATDNDLVILDPEVGRASSVVLATAPENLRLGVFNIVNGQLGPARAFTAVASGFSDTTIDFGVLQGPVALRIGNATPDELEVAVTFKQAQDGDTCTNPLPLVIEGERSGVVTGDSTSYNNDVDASEVGDCTNERAPGRDVIYVVHLEAGETLRLTGDLTGDVEDVSLYLLRDCVLDDNSCVAGIDAAGGLVAESIEFENGAAARDYFVVVDSFYGAPYLWELEWSITAP